MRSNRRSIACALSAAMLVALTPFASAGPTVIRDVMLQDTAITPTLGRGYSISTNTFQSMCLTDVVGTTPSYNFDYDFRELTEDEVETGILDKSNNVKAAVVGAQDGGQIDIGTLT